MTRKLAGINVMSWRVKSLVCSFVAVGCGMTAVPAVDPQASQGEQNNASADAGADGGTAGAGGEPADSSLVGGEVPVGTPGLFVNAVSFRNVGRHGEDLRVAVKGRDPSRTTSSMHVRLVDKDGNPVPALDTDWDGEPDSAEKRYRFSESTLGQDTFMGAVIIPRVYSATSPVARVVVALENEAGQRSDSKEQPLATQAIKASGESCDALKIVNRCDDGLACIGNPATCKEGGAPVLSRVAYFGGNTPKMIFEGTDSDEDIEHIDIEFLDAQDNAKSVDLGPEDQPAYQSEFRLSARYGTVGAQFYLATNPVTRFVQLVPKIGVTASDLRGQRSARQVVAVTNPTLRTVGQPCDPAGFDMCAAGSVCTPGVVGVKNQCSFPIPLRSAKCSAAPLLNPGKGKTTVFGKAEGVSLWDAPADCVSPENLHARPESTVRLRLDSPAPTLIISTALPETEFDTVLYLLPGCATSSASALGCNDDVQGYSSTLTLRDVPAGDYTIVVDSVRPKGGRFGVSVEVQGN